MGQGRADSFTIAGVFVEVSHVERGFAGCLLSFFWFFYFKWGLDHSVCVSAAAFAL